MLLRRSGIQFFSTTVKKLSLVTCCSQYSNGIKRLSQETEYSNLSDHIREKVDRKLLLLDHHPLQIIKTKIFNFFNSDKYPTRFPGTNFECFDQLPKVVSVKENFDNLLTPLDHPSRKKDESYYLNENELLRCHMTAHQVSLLSQNKNAFLFAGDVYRRDTIDSTHYPIFHQLDGVRVFKEADLVELSKQTGKSAEELVAEDMKNGLEQLMKELFGPQTESKWIDAYFPFTDPSWEMEILFNQHSSKTNQQTDWLEVLGCGLINKQIIKPVRSDSIGWAFGLGLERLAMILFNIPDIRLFWSTDRRFLDQFNASKPLVPFKPFSKFPACFKDITFWIPENFTDNNFYELAREHAGDLVESIELLDHFTHPKTKRQSKCFRLNYRSMERSLTNEEINALQEDFRNLVVSRFGVELR